MSFHWRCSLLLALLLLTANRVMAQDQDTASVDTAVIYTFNVKDYHLDSLNRHMDFSLYEVQRYGAMNAGFPLLFVGNMGHAGYSPIYQMSGKTSLYQSVNSGFNPYMLHHDNVVYHQTDIPYTSLAYLSGSKREEAIRLVHSRNFGKKLNVSVKLDKGGSEGFYTHQNLRTSNFDVSTNFKSRDERYGFIGHYYHNRIDANENGGYENARSFESIGDAGAPNLTNASNSLREQGIMFNQYYDLGRSVVDSSGYKDFTPRFRIGFDLEYTDAFRRYFDAVPNPLYYNDIFLDSTETRDSIYTNQLIYKPSLGFIIGENVWTASFAQESFNYGLPYFAFEEYSNQWAGVEYKGKFGKSHALVMANYGLDGYNESDVNARGRFHWNMANSNAPKRAMLLKVHYNLETPNPYMQRYISNHLIWDNNFGKQLKMGGEIQFQRKRVTITALVDHLSDPVIFGPGAVPIQVNERVQIFGARGRYELQFGRFVLDNRVHYQYATNRNVVPLPSLLFNESFYYTNNIADSPLELRVGVDLFYYTAVAGFDYMPASNQFYTQESPGEQLGGYPYFDLFLSIRLKRAYFLIKFSHVNEGMAGNGYYQVPNYPTPPTALKFGIKWVLFN